MTRTAKDTETRWIAEFTDELQQRHVSKSDAGDALDCVRQHLADSTQSPSHEFGDPRAYAASLNLRQGAPGFGRTGNLLAVFIACGSLFAFGMALIDWADGNKDNAVLLWIFGAATAMLAAAVWLTISTAKQVVAAVVRERFDGETAGVWSKWAPLAIAAPWGFPIIAAALLAGIVFGA